MKMRGAGSDLDESGMQSSGYPGMGVLLQCFIGIKHWWMHA